MSFQQNYEKLVNWLTEVEAGDKWRYGDVEDDEPRGKFIIATAMNNYFISFTENYLGCVANSRVVWAGETWTRGNDLPDGDFSRQTFDRIMQGIVRYELVELAPVHEAVLTPSEESGETRTDAMPSVSHP